MTTVKINTKIIGLDKTISVHKTLNTVQGLQAIAVDVSGFQGEIAQKQLEVELKNYPKQIADKKAEIATADESQKDDLEHELRILELQREIDESKLSKYSVNSDQEFINETLDRISNLLKLDEQDSKTIHDNIPDEKAFGQFIGYLKLRIIDEVSEADANKALAAETKKAKTESKAENLNE